MKRNSLVNQVKYLGLAHTFVAVSPSNDENIFKTAQKQYGYSSKDKKILLL